MNKLFLQYGHSKWPKRGIFGRFLGVKLKLSFLSLLEGIFLPSPRTIFSRMPRKISALTDKRFSSYGRFKRLKKGYFWLFFGCKIETQLPEPFRRSFFNKSKNYLF
jgi:hypothetical protein